MPQQIKSRYLEGTAAQHRSDLAGIVQGQVLQHPVETAATTSQDSSHSGQRVVHEWSNSASVHRRPIVDRQYILRGELRQVGAPEAQPSAELPNPVTTPHASTPSIRPTSRRPAARLPRTRRLATRTGT